MLFPNGKKTSVNLHGTMSKAPYTSYKFLWFQADRESEEFY